MLRILGSNRRACDALSRRDMIQAGGASLLGLGLADLLHANEGNEPQLTRGFGRAKNVILLFLYGGVSQLDTLDPKPSAPEDIRGPFSSISTSLTLAIRTSFQVDSKATFISLRKFAFN